MCTLWNCVASDGDGLKAVVDKLVASAKEGIDGASTTINIEQLQDAVVTQLQDIQAKESW